MRIAFVSPGLFAMWMPCRYKGQDRYRKYIRNICILTIFSMCWLLFTRLVVNGPEKVIKRPRLLEIVSNIVFRNSSGPKKLSKIYSCTMSLVWCCPVQYDTKIFCKMAAKTWLYGCTIFISAVFLQHISIATKSATNRRYEYANVFPFGSAGTLLAGRMLLA